MRAFTMIELVFVIVILGILAAVAVPRLAASRDDAILTKGKADVSAIRSSIITTRQRNILQGNASAPSTLTTTGSEYLFDAVLDYPIKSVDSDKNGWRRNGDNYVFRTENTDITFRYDNTTGIFTCVGANTGTANNTCTKLTQ
jgi:general secretion pathway protein G